MENKNNIVSGQDKEYSQLCDMTPEEMKSELTRQLEFFNSHRSKRDNLKMDELIIERMRGFIELAYNLKIISDAEKNELNYIYFNEEAEPNEPE